jgi:hypothetical protein
MYLLLYLNNERRNSLKRDQIKVDHGHPEGDKTFIAVISGGNHLQAYQSCGNNIFDIVPSNTGVVRNSICSRCLNFIKEGDCKEKELQKKIARVKLYSCEKFVSKENIQQVKGEEDNA